MKAKKLIFVWLMLTVLLLTPITVSAEQNITGDFFNKNLNMNGEILSNYELQYSFVMCNDAMYMPLSKDICKIVGVEAEIDWDGHTLKLLKTKPTQKNFSERWLKNDNQDISLNRASNWKIKVYQETPQQGDVIGALDLAIESIDLKGSSILVKDDILYVPIGALMDSQVLGWSSYFDNNYGICISTHEGVNAKEYWDEGESNYNGALVNYVKSYNQQLSTTKAQELVFLFKRAAAVNHVDEKLLMAIAQKESKFQANAISSGGARGIMQIMPRTTASYGISAAQLLNPKTNIDFGAHYIANGIERYGGNTTIALSAYNQGSGTVSRGSYSTGYANTVLAAYHSIANYAK
ncbi:MAG: lytic transglycosylase domain-containing protein [Anaerovorax sp.]